MFDGEAFGAEIVAAVKSYVDKTVAPLLARIAELEARAPERGEPGPMGPQGETGISGEKGDPGSDGISIVDAMLDSEGHLVTIWGTGESKRVGRVVGKDGAPGRNGANGKDGADGFGFDDMAVLYDGERTFTLNFQKGDATKELSFRMPIPIYRGVFEPAKAYERGDSVTRNGGLHIALQDNPPGMPNTGEDSGWKLAAKPGRDAKTPVKL